MLRINDNIGRMAADGNVVDAVIDLGQSRFNFLNNRLAGVQHGGTVCVKQNNIFQMHLHISTGILNLNFIFQIVLLDVILKDDINFPQRIGAAFAGKPVGIASAARSGGGGDPGNEIIGISGSAAGGGAGCGSEGLVETLGKGFIFLRIDRAHGVQHEEQCEQQGNHIGISQEPSAAVCRLLLRALSFFHEIITLPVSSRCRLYTCLRSSGKRGSKATVYFQYCASFRRLQASTCRRQSCCGKSAGV